MKILVAIGVLIVVGVLLTGISVMFRGGEVNAKYSNKLMQLRVAAQAVVVVMIMIFLWASGSGPS